MPEEHECHCGAHNDEEIILDARTIPHAVRHAAIFGALSGLQPGQTLELVAPHDPLPLLAQLEQQAPGAFDVAYGKREAAEVHVLLTRQP